MIDRFKRILVPLDFTEQNQGALDVAMEIATSNDATVFLVHVVEPIELMDTDVDDFITTLKERAHHELRIRAQPFVEAKINVTTHVAFGKRTHEIVNFEADQDINLIILNSHPLDLQAPEKADLASLSYRVGMLAGGPVLLVK